MVRELGDAASQETPGTPQATARVVSHTATAHPAVLVDQGPRDQPPIETDTAVVVDHGSPLFAVPGLVLVAALAIFEAYHWLHLIPSGSARPTAILFLVGVVPVTVALTRRFDGPAPGVLCALARLAAVMVLLLGLAELVVRDVPLTRVVGVTAVVLAGTLLVLAVASEAGERRRSGNL